MRNFNSFPMCLQNGLLMKKGLSVQHSSIGRILTLNLAQQQLLIKIKESEQDFLTEKNSITLANYSGKRKEKKKENNTTGITTADSTPQTNKRQKVHQQE